MSPGGWSGAHWSAARIGLALWIAQRAGALGLPAEIVVTLWVLGAVFAAGAYTRIAGSVLAILVVLRGEDLVLTVCGVLVAALAFAPGVPWGSWERRGAVDPGTDWVAPEWWPPVVWAALSLGYLVGPVPALLALGFGIAGLWPSARPVAWVAMAAVLLAVDAWAWLPLHLLAAQPRWIPARDPDALDEVYYDGACGLCHQTVRMLLAEDVEGRRFRFSPLQSEHVAKTLDDATRAGLPDSIVVQLPSAALRVRSAAILRLWERLGGGWRVLAVVAQLVPPRVRDALYDVLARSRYRIFGTRDESCPVMPPELRERFLL